MASEVDIVNLALAHLGDAATVASINPPDGSAQAEYGQRFYPIARDLLLEMHDWAFATKRMALAQLSSNPASTWAYCYAVPADLLNTISVLDPTAVDDVSVGLLAPTALGCGTSPTPIVTAGGVYTPQPFTLENVDGSDVVLTNQPSAVLRYVARVTDTTRFSPLFVDCLAAVLASMMAGSVIKGDAGAAAAARWTLIAFGQDGRSGKFGRAAASDAAQKRTTALRDRQQVPWLVGR